MYYIEIKSLINKLRRKPEIFENSFRMSQIQNQYETIFYNLSTIEELIRTL